MKAGASCEKVLIWRWVVHTAGVMVSWLGGPDGEALGRGRRFSWVCWSEREGSRAALGRGAGRRRARTWIGANGVGFCTCRWAGHRPERRRGQKGTIVNRACHTLQSICDIGASRFGLRPWNAVYGLPREGHLFGREALEMLERSEGICGPSWSRLSDSNFAAVCLNFETR
jgi:hypothetical protein